MHSQADGNHMNLQATPAKGFFQPIWNGMVVDGTME